jgi:hypothetical protein
MDGFKGAIRTLAASSLVALFAGCGGEAGQEGLTGAGADDGLATTEQAVCGPPADIWQQFVEKVYPPATVKAVAHASYYYTTTTFCDNDPDTDYVFVFRLNYSCNPDSLKWYSSDGWATTLLGDLNSRSPVATDDDVHVCIGDNHVNFLGVNSILQNMYVYVP